MSYSNIQISDYIILSSHFFSIHFDVPFDFLIIELINKCMLRAKDRTRMVRFLPNILYLDSNLVNSPVSMLKSNINLLSYQTSI